VIAQDNGLMVSASADETVKIWKASKALLTVFRSHAAGLLDVDAQGDLIATASDDKTVKLWHRESWRESHVDPLVTLEGHENGILGVAISPDAEFIVSGSWDHTLKVWQPDGTLLTTLTGHQVPITEVAISPDGQFIASAGLEGTIKLWAVDRQNPRNVELLASLEEHRDRVHDVTFSPDGQYLASSSEDQTLRVWSLTSDSGQLQVNDPLILSAHTAGVRAVAFSPDSQYLASASDDQTLRLWRIQSFPEPQITLEKVFHGHLREVQAVAFHPEQPLLVSGSTDETIKVWRADEGTLLTTLNGHKAAVTGLAFSGDGQLLSSSRDRTLIAWNLAEVLSENRILADGCAWISEYLEHNPQVSSEELPICQTLMTEETARR
jgi:WD40 repeat protein